MNTSNGQDDEGPSIAPCNAKPYTLVYSRREHTLPPLFADLASLSLQLGPEAGLKICVQAVWSQEWGLVKLQGLKA